MALNSMTMVAVMLNVLCVTASTVLITASAKSATKDSNLMVWEAARRKSLNTKKAASLTSVFASWSIVREPSASCTRPWMGCRCWLHLGKPEEHKANRKVDQYY